MINRRRLLALTDYLRIIVRRGWIMVLLALLAGGAAFLISRGQTPIYRSTQVVLIQASRADLGLAEASVRLVTPLTVYLNSRERATEIIEKLDLDMLPDQLQGNSYFAADQLRMTIQIDVDNADGELGNQIAREWGQLLVDYRNAVNQKSRREDRVDAVLVDYPRYTQQSPRPTISLAIGAILGLVLGGILVFVLEYAESGVIRNAQDLTRATDAPLIASIPQE
jgi:capsular polysaccharide biosynthesis protein